MTGVRFCYIGFGLTLIAFFVMFNAYKDLQSDMVRANDRITELKNQIDKQSKPCQEEDLKFPELSSGCTIPPTSSPTSSLPPTSNEENKNNVTTGGSPPPTTPTTSSPGEGKPEPPKDEEPLIGCIIGVCL